MEAGAVAEDVYERRNGSEEWYHGRSEGSALVPVVVEQTARGERAYDIYSMLLRNGSSSSAG